MDSSSCRSNTTRFNCKRQNTTRRGGAEVIEPVSTVTSQGTPSSDVPAVPADVKAASKPVKKTGSQLFGSKASCKTCKYWKDNEGWHKTKADEKELSLSAAQEKQLDTKLGMFEAPTVEAKKEAEPKAKEATPPSGAPAATKPVAVPSALISLKAEVKTAQEAATTAISEDNYSGDVKARCLEAVRAEIIGDAASRGGYFNVAKTQYDLAKSLYQAAKKLAENAPAPK